MGFGLSDSSERMPFDTAFDVEIGVTDERDDSCAMRSMCAYRAMRPTNGRDTASNS